MSKLNDEQLKFLLKHDIPLSRVFDASGLLVPVWTQAMKDLEMWVAYGGSKCAAAGHQLRSRKSVCLQCRPAEIGYLKRYFADGEVYVATSKSKGIVKVGTAKDSAARVVQLSYYQYGGASDWSLQVCVSCKAAGKVEFEAHRILTPHLHYGTYFKDGEDRECRELFSCSQTIAAQAVDAALFNCNEGAPLRTIPARSTPQQPLPSTSPADIPKKRIYVLKKPPPNVQAVRGSVNEFASELGLPLQILLEQFRLAGVNKQSADEKITDHDKAALLDYLRSQHKQSIVPKKPRTPPIPNKWSQMCDRARVGRDQRNAEKLTQELTAQDQLRNYYFSMPLDQLRTMWNNGENELEGEEAQMVRIAIRNKSGIA